MRLAPTLSQFLYSLLFSSLVFAANALPIESTELLVLTPDNFKDTIAHGVWFIEHFSPYCGHCQHFFPTWVELVETYASQPNPPVYFAQVDCAVNGDLCVENNVDGYPQMNLYRDGQFVDTYKQSRDLKHLTAYLSKRIESFSPSQPATIASTVAAATITAATTTASVPALPAPTQGVEKKPLAELLSWKSPGGNTYNPTGTVAVLNDQTFQDTVSRGHSFVKFYAPWCGHCKKLAPTWTELAHTMRGKLDIAEVNCEDHGALCKTQGVTGFPALFYYPDAKNSKMEYTGGRKLEQLIAFSERLSGPPVLELGDGELDQVVAGHPVVYLLLHPESDIPSVKRVVESSRVLFGTPPIYISSSTALFNKYAVDPSNAVLIALKDHETKSVAAHYSVSQSSSNSKDLETWLLRNKLPTVLELNADSFQEVMNAPHHPLVVIVAAPRAEATTVASSLGDIATRWKNSRSGENVVFAWMDAEKWATWLKNMYGIKGSLPQVVISNHSKLIFYDKDQHGKPIILTATSILSALNGAARGTIPYRHSENFIERTARYINDKMIGVEGFVSTRPWTVVAFVIGGILGLYFLLRRLLADDVPADGPQYRRVDGRGKASRLD